MIIERELVDILKDGINGTTRYFYRVSKNGVVFRNGHYADVFFYLYKERWSLIKYKQGQYFNVLKDGHLTTKVCNR